MKIARKCHSLRSKILNELQIVYEFSSSRNINHAALYRVSKQQNYHITLLLMNEHIGRGKSKGNNVISFTVYTLAHIQVGW